MEDYQGSNPITVVKVRNICCEVYQKKLKKGLAKLDGVFSVDINPENGLVSIKGEVDANTLLKTVSRTGKTAEIVYPKDQKTCCCEETSKCRKQHEEEHQCEDYVPPFIEERMCRDYYRSHRMRPLFRDHVHGSEYPMFFGPFPGGGDQYGPQWFAEPPWGGHGFRPGRPLPGFHNYIFRGW